jgi:hypothetical protein
MRSHVFETLYMPSHQCSHVIVPWQTHQAIYHMHTTHKATNTTRNGTSISGYMATGDTFDATVVQPDNLRTLSVTERPDVYVCIHRVDDWRRAQDFVYRLLTGSDTRELNECVLGLISSGEHGANIGLIRRRHTNTVHSTQLMDSIENDITQSNLQKCDKLHRITCHFFIFVDIVLEPDFVTYALLRTHNRDALRYYINDVLRPILSKLLTGGMLDGSNEDRNAFDVVEFVQHARHLYSLYCLPRHTACTV